MALGGLVLSLTVRRRRVFVRVAPAPDGAGQQVSIAGLARGEDPLLQDAIDDFAGRLRISLDAEKAPDATSA